ncbi:Glyoxalase/bleomycin resistance protein/dioxygenase [Beutenbergia cavernae DSM 12333]|uniref:Glyoxalase/bleomycin resistance protein/dioxygenase n=1 Tax=Beutenbergia cavernae (strain ATCC BAA-8 / DSM 12333 / CCUG 43141 / JCM 11478 / NBRC 16432 / NCIMB 13614 / HKI 0122) TaxID=471853 RepID=C5C3Y9_BEUC1|nr:VOC family protein [Beutenbergia cavernae]ACQ79902.1 Glyoxalase/bleomycin resistance protein/dioxygenase [Beutenbergia cavernae DSM 12333]
MATRLNPYLSFRGQAREAMEFYRSVLGGELTVSTFGEFQMAQDPAEQDWVMHSQLETADGFTLMGADTPSGMDHTVGNAYSVSLSGDDEPQLREWFEKLSDGGTVQEPFVKAPWGDTFGMVTDKYGVAWMVNAAGAGG